MPNYRYKGACCGNYVEHFSPTLVNPLNDPQHGEKCGQCQADGCVQQRVMSRPQRPLGFREWAGDWFKKTYGHDIGERDSAYASEQASLDKMAAETLRDYNIKAGGTPPC